MMDSNFQSISDDVVLGSNVRIYKFVNLYGCQIGDDCKIGTFVEIQKNVVIGRRCKISSHTFICEGVKIEDNVFIGHNVAFINDKYPRATTADGELQTEDDWQVMPTYIRKNSSIGSGCTILGGLEIGENSIIGAGSTVTKSIPPNVIAAGNPAKVIRQIK